MEVAAAGIGDLDGITLTHGGTRARVGDLEKGVVLPVELSTTGWRGCNGGGIGGGRRNDNGF